MRDGAIMNRGRPTRWVVVLAALAFSLVLAERARPAEIWPQWRGPEGQGHAPAARDLPVTWSETENIAWKTPLPGRGWSSPVLDDRHVWMTTALESEASSEEREQRLQGNTGNQPLNVSGPVRMHAL